MLRLGFSFAESAPVNILCLGAHSDDIEIGCGGTLLNLGKSVEQLKFHWVVFSAAGDRRQAAVNGAEFFASGCDKEVILKEYRDGFLPYSGEKVKNFFEELKTKVNPDLIFTHWRGDAHQDHRLISELTWNTFRNHLILEYEIPKFDGDMGQPQLFMPIEKTVADRKVDELLRVFESQRKKPWFDRELFMGLMRMRGMEANSPSGYAEAFHCRKLVVE